MRLQKNQLAQAFKYQIRSQVKNMYWRMPACVHLASVSHSVHVLPDFLPHFSLPPPFLPSTLPPCLSGSLSMYIHVTVSLSLMSHIPSAESEFQLKVKRVCCVCVCVHKTVSLTVYLTASLSVSVSVNNSGCVRMHIGVSECVGACARRLCVLTC